MTAPDNRRILRTTNGDMSFPGFLIGFALKPSLRIVSKVGKARYKVDRIHYRCGSIWQFLRTQTDFFEPGHGRTRPNKAEYEGNAGGRGMRYRRTAENLRKETRPPHAAGIPAQQPVPRRTTPNVFDMTPKSVFSDWTRQ